MQKLNGKVNRSLSLSLKVVLFVSCLALLGLFSGCAREHSLAVGAPQDTVGTLTGGPDTGVTLSDLPPKAVKAMQQYAPDGEIDFITKETHADQITYIVAFKKNSRPTLYITQDGTILKAPPR